MTRAYHWWSDEEMWELFCWYIAKRRLGNNISKALDLGTQPANLCGQIKRARETIAQIEARLGKTHEDRERRIQQMLA